MEGFSFEAFTRVRDKGNTHEEDTVGGGGRGHAGGFDGFACLCLARRLGSGYWPRPARRRHHRRRDRLQSLSVRPAITARATTMAAQVMPAAPTAPATGSASASGTATAGRPATCGFASNPFSYIKSHMASRQIPFHGTPFIQRLKSTAFSDDVVAPVYRGLTVLAFASATASSKASVESFPAQPGALSRHLQERKST